MGGLVIVYLHSVACVGDKFRGSITSGLSKKARARQPEVPLLCVGSSHETCRVDVKLGVCVCLAVVLKI